MHLIRIFSRLFFSCFSLKNFSSQYLSGECLFLPFQFNHPLFPYSSMTFWCAYHLLQWFIRRAKEKKVGDAYWMRLVVGGWVCAYQLHGNCIELNWIECMAWLTIKLYKKPSHVLSSSLYLSNIPVILLLCGVFRLIFLPFFYCIHIENTFCCRHFYWYVCVFFSASALSCSLSHSPYWMRSIQWHISRSSWGKRAFVPIWAFQSASQGAAIAMVIRRIYNKMLS